MTPADGKAGFARRLNEAFDQLDIPPKQRGRFTAIGKLFSVSPVAARDWCEGNSYPSVDKLLLIMDTVRCGADWLLFGRKQATAALAATMPRPVDDHRVTQAGPPGNAAGPTAIPSSAGTDPGTGLSVGIGMESGPACPATTEPLRWLCIAGESMAPTLQHGDLVGCTPVEDDLTCWQDGLYALASGQALPSDVPDEPGRTADPGSVHPATLAVPLPAGHRVIVRRAVMRSDGLIALTCDHPALPQAELVRRQSGMLWVPVGPVDASSGSLQVLGRIGLRQHRLT